MTRSGQSPAFPFSGHRLSMMGMAFLGRSEGSLVFHTYNELFMLILLLIQVTFVVFAATLIARLVIEEYKNKTIALMFSYPIDRKKLMIAKLCIVFAFSFVTILLSNIVITAAVSLLTEQFALIPDTLNRQMLTEHAWNVLISTLAASGISLMPVFFGMWKKSVPTTIVSSFLIITILFSNNNGFTLSSYVAISLGFACLGLLLAYLSIRNIHKADVM